MTVLRRKGVSVDLKYGNGRAPLSHAGVTAQFDSARPRRVGKRDGMARKVSILVGILMAFCGSVALAAPTLAPEPPLVLIPREAITAIAPRTAAVDEIVKLPSIVFRHGDCSWLAPLALAAGWPAETLGRLEEIIQRESGCCPNRRGGDVVNRRCQIVRVSEWNHRSDTGLLQINGVHWKQDHPQYHGLVCKRLGVCDQETLLDPMVNLRAGKLLWDVAGWSPWNPIN